MKRVALAFGVAAFLAGCSSIPLLSPSNSGTDSATPSQTCWVSPLTGECSTQSQPTMVVKIDDVIEARPQYSLNAADLIVVEPVEGGLTRIFAMYQTNQPTLVGPVRSARITDPDIAEAFGIPGFAYSGSNNKVKPLLQAASIQLVGAPQGGKGYYREAGRNAPHNLIGIYADLVSRIKQPAQAAMNTTSSWNFSDTPTQGTKVQDVIVKWPGEKKTFTWNDTLKSWTIKSFKADTVSLDPVTKESVLATAQTVFVMQTYLLPNPTSHVTPYPKTYGEGSGYILTQGQVIPVTWKRPTVKDLPHWYLASGKEVSIAKGRVWWAIAADNDKVTVEYPATPTPSGSKS
jgi:hypothetical protein